MSSSPGALIVQGVLPIILGTPIAHNAPCHPLMSLIALCHFSNPDGTSQTKKSNLNLIFTRYAQIQDILEVDILSWNNPSNWNVDNPALNGSSFSVECLILIPWLARVILHLCIPRLGILTHAIIIRLICYLFCQTFISFKAWSISIMGGIIGFLHYSKQIHKSISSSVHYVILHSTIGWRKVKMCQFSSGKPHSLWWRVKGATTTLRTCRQGCDKYDLTAAQCLLLAHHNDWSKWFVISTPPTYFAVPVSVLWVGCKNVSN
jgi:hypothetical protein